MGKREEYLRDAVHRGIGPDGREYEWRVPTMADVAHSWKAVPHLLASATVTQNSDGSTTVTIEKLDALIGKRKREADLIKSCLLSPRVTDDKDDPDEEAVLFWTLREDVQVWLARQLEADANLQSEEAAKAQAFRSEPAELQDPHVDGGSVRSEAVGSVSG